MGMAGALEGPIEDPFAARGLPPEAPCGALPSRRGGPRGSASRPARAWTSRQSCDRNACWGGQMRRLAIVVLALFALVLPAAARGGDNFWLGTNGPQGGDVIAMAANGSTVFAGTQGGGVFRSTDHGDSWAQANAGLTDTNVRALAVTPEGHVFAGTFSGVFRSMDNGSTWTQVNNGLDYPFIDALTVNDAGDIF